MELLKKKKLMWKRMKKEKNLKLERLERVQRLKERRLSWLQELRLQWLNKENHQKRSRKKPSWMRDFISGEEESEEEETKINFTLYVSNDDRVRFEVAVKEEGWREAMKHEIQSTEKNHMWELVSLPAQVKKIRVKWVYKTNLNEKGRVKKYKA